MSGLDTAAVLFDLDGTLYDYQRAHEAGLEAGGDLAQRTLGLNWASFKRSYADARARIHRRLTGTAASHSRLLYFNELVSTCGTQDVALAARLDEAYWTRFIDTMNLYEGARELLDRLRQNGARLAIVTDMTTATQHRKIERLGLSGVFDVVVTSEEAGCEKPDRRIFALCLEKLNMANTDVIHVGDDYARDVEGARGAGIRPVLMLHDDRHAGPAGVSIARSFADLSAILQGSSASV